MHNTMIHSPDTPTGQEESVRAHFDAESQRWKDIYLVERPWRGRDQNFFSRLQHVKSLIRESQGDLLDVGCGTGVVTAALYHPGITGIQGIDFAPSMVDLAEDYARRIELPVPLQFQVADAEKTGFSDQSFDVITAIGVLEYADSPLPLLAEFARIARPGATVVITTPNRCGFLWNWHTRVALLARETLRPLATLIKYRILGRAWRPVGKSEHIRHTAYTSREMSSIAEQAGLVLDKHLYCTFAFNLIETVLPIGGPVSRMMDRVADKTWLTWPACNLIVRLRRPR